MRNGDTKTLQSVGFMKSKPTRELIVDADDLHIASEFDGWQDTACCAASSRVPLQMQRVVAFKTQCRYTSLYKVSDLVVVFDG